MESILENWPVIVSRLRNARHIILLLDYDGTLTPIVSTPEKVILDKDIKEILTSLSKGDKFSIGIISGRRLSEIKEMVNIKGIFYCGNHGLEIEGQGVRVIYPTYKYLRPVLGAIKEILQKEIKDIKGAWIEDKGLSLTLHYRLVQDRDIPRIKEIFRYTTSSYIKTRRIKISLGKKVLEVRPPARWNKGRAVRVIEKLVKKKRGDLTIYLGDDITDEDAFRALGKRDIAVFVGVVDKSRAGYFLKDTKQVKNFLKRIQWLS